MNTELLHFLEGKWFDTHGRMINEIEEWDNTRLELVHDYIQWVFPLKERSIYNVDAPLLDDETIHAIKDSTQAMLNIIYIHERMCDFYELWNYEVMKKWWVKPHNHNYLRITRILTFLNLVGLHDEMYLMFDQLTDVYNHDENRNTISDRTLQFWIKATSKDIS